MILAYPTALSSLIALVCVVVSMSAEARPETPPPNLGATSDVGTVDLRPLFEKWDLTQRRQGSRGTCSVFAVTGALEFAVANKQQHAARLSPEFLNWAAHTAVHRTEDGGFFSELWKGYEAFGICPEEDQPYQSDFDVNLHPATTTLEHAQHLRSLGLTLHWIKEWNPHTGLTDRQMAAIRHTITNQEPVCGGFRWPKKPVWTESVLQMCPAEEVFDGHSVLLVGYKDDTKQPGGGVFLIRNSGGDASDGWLPYAYVQTYMNDAAFIESNGTSTKVTVRPASTTKSPSNK